MAKQNICGRPIPVLPSVYQETLTYGETLGVVAQKVNECVDEVNNNDKKVDDLTNLVGTFDSRITTNTEEINAVEENIAIANSRIDDLMQDTAQSLSNLSTQIVETNKKVDTNTTSIEDLQGQIEGINDIVIPSIDARIDDLTGVINATNTKVNSLETRTNDIVSSINTLTQDVLDNTTAIAKSKEKMVLLSDITISQDTGGTIELIRDTRISTFYIETSIPAVANITNGQLICDYTEEGQNIYLSTLFARNKTITNMTINAIVTGGFHLFLAAQHSASAPSVLGSTQAAIYTENTIVTKIRFRLLNNVSIPAGSTFKIYGIVED